MDWTARAARRAVTDDLRLLLPLLSDLDPDPDPEVRSATVQVLAATGEPSRLSSALRLRLTMRQSGRAWSWRSPDSPANTRPTTSPVGPGPPVGPWATA
ncbi:hypothetical protein [Kitasatospora griseola]|uniref:hypothetical protein n=1 Tax=Kitasatospora griseola TaxID=2064 RepID=UPI0037FD347C